jgi:hypothetical protein
MGAWAAHPQKLADVFQASSGLRRTAFSSPYARTRARLEQHWEASERGGIDTEHDLRSTRDPGLPPAQELFQGRSSIQAQRGGHPAERHFIILRFLGGGDLWVNECVITYNGVPA